MRKKLMIGLMITLFTLAGTGIVIPLAFSYLSSLEDEGIAIRAAQASEIWAMDGSFDEGLWKETADTGINITNICHKDLWIFYEYTGDLKQVFKQSGPVWVEAGEDIAVVLKPLDDMDSPRILNPLELIEFTTDVDSTCETGTGGINGWQWKALRGTVKIHTLNCFAELESEEMIISGQTLWEIFFANKYQTDPGDYYELACPEAQPLELTSTVSTREMQGSELESAAPQQIEDAQYFISRITSYEEIQYLQQVLDALDKIAPGLWNEHNYYAGELAAAAENMQQSIHTMEDFISEQERLQDQIFEQQETIQRLQEEIAAMRDENEPSIIMESEAEPAAPLEEEQVSAEAPAGTEDY